VNNNEWINCASSLPEIDYENKKSSIRIKIRNMGKEKTAYFRTIIMDDVVYGIFYNLKEGTVYKHVTEWKYIKRCGAKADGI